MIHLSKAHPGITLQDLGRNSGLDKGYSRGGALDEVSFQNANKLLGNPATSPAIEIVLGGAQLEFQKPTTMALCGADLSFELNGAAIKMNQTFQVSSGDTLRAKAPKDGLIAYLAVLEGFEAVRHFGSVSIPQRESSLFCKSDSFCYTANEKNVRAEKITPLDLNQNKFEFYPSYQHDSFQYDELTFTKSARFNRMGAFASCTKQISYEAPPIKSEGIVVGAIQVINNTEVALLFNDCQSIGGYPKLGVLSKTAKCQLAQLLPQKGFSLKPKAV